MKSMTGFGYGEYRDDCRQVLLSLKAYNNRFLDIVVYLPPSLAPLEQRFRDYLASRVLRGRVELSLKLNLTGPGKMLPDVQTVRSHLKALRELTAAAGIRERIRISHLLRLEGLFRPEASLNVEEIWGSLEPTLEAVFKDFEGMRGREGE
ncbi:MAG: YicC family protein, partial [Spirochaetales bacterium]|nr:YicC family protein [Spirochaetales bacterium]